MSSNTPKRIEDVDANFVSKATSGHCLRWIDAFSPELALRGLAWVEENRAARSFRRCPDRAAASLSEGVQLLSHCPASAFLSFQTDSSVISVRMRNENAQTMAHIPLTGFAGAELYMRDGSRWVTLAVAIPDLDSATFERELVVGWPSEMREYRLYLPLYKRVEELSIGVEEGATVIPIATPSGQKPIFFYGTSITQGGCANTTGSDFVSIVGRMLDTEVVNFGFSGNGKGEAEVAQLIREVDAEMFILDYVANCSAELLAKTLPPFLKILREVHPETPVVLVGALAFDRTLWSPVAEIELHERRDVMMAFYLKTKGEGDVNLHFIDGHGLVQPGMSGIFVDGVHPTSGGFIQIAERLAPQLAAICAWHKLRVK